MTILADHGRNCQPYADGPTVRACDLELVRQEFNCRYPAEGTDRQKADARRKAFKRALLEAQSAGLLQTREVDGLQLVWPKAGSGGQIDGRPDDDVDAPDGERKFGEIGGEAF